MAGRTGGGRLGAPHGSGVWGEDQGAHGEKEKKFEVFYANDHDWGTFLFGTKQFARYRGSFWQKSRGLKVKACWAAEFFTIWPFFRKFLSNRPLAERIPEMDPWLGARVTGAELGATVTGAELLDTGKWPARGSAPE